MTVPLTIGPALKENSIIRHQTSLGQGYAVRKKGKKNRVKLEPWPGEMSPGYATLSPLQTTSQLASLADLFFFRPRQFFSPFSPNAEPGPRLTPNRPYGCLSQKLRLDLTIKYFFVNLHVPGNASIRTCTATFLVCDFSISDLGFLDSSRSFPLGHIASFSLSR